MSLKTIQKMSVMTLLGTGILAGCAGPGINQAPVTIRETLPMTQNDSSNKLMSACNTVITSVQTLDTDLIPCLMDSNRINSTQISEHIQDSLQTVSYQKSILQQTRAASVLENQFADAIESMEDLETTLNELNKLAASNQLGGTLTETLYQDLSQSVNELKRLSTAF